MSYRCPNCKGTKFSVKVIGFQKWNSKDDEYDSVEDIEISEDDDTYFCLNCEHSFKNLYDLEEIK